MPATTVHIFTQTAQLLTSLLDYDPLKTKEKHKHSNQIQITIQSLQQTLEDINRSAKVKLRGGGKVRGPSEDHENLELQLVTAILNLCRAVPATYEVQAAPYFARPTSTIASDFRQSGWSTDANSDARQLTSEHIISKEEVLYALSFRDSDNKKDINDYLKSAEISGHEKAQLALTQEDAFQDWLKEDRRSSALVIHGNPDNDDENSPISYLVAQIGEKYHKKRGYVVLSWFCNLNTDENSAAIMARLTCQLLSQATRVLSLEDFNFVTRNEYKKLKQLDLKTLNRVFLNTIQKLRLKRIVVFCLIDSISIYETDNLRKDTEKMVEFFRSLVRPPHRQTQEDMKQELIFKLLISDEQSSELAIKYFKDKEILEMDDQIDTDVDSDASLIV